MSVHVRCPDEALPKRTAQQMTKENMTTLKSLISLYCFAQVIATGFYESL
jgi:hypothetical protein